MKISLLLLVGLASFAVFADAFTHGQMRMQQSQWQAWDHNTRQWVTPDAFWQRYAEEKGGLTWGSGRHYPPYEQVQEGDTFLVIVDAGPCLMEFFHQRWRRANDVRRWDERFNTYAGCPWVFDG